LLFVRNNMINNKLKILYVDMGGVAVYSCDKTAGRVSNWANMQNDVFLLLPGLITETAEKEICNISKFPGKIKIITLPFSNKKRPSAPGIILSYSLRVLFSPLVLFKKLPRLDIGYSNSPVLVDIMPILILKFFGRCKHWILMFDSIVPRPSQRSGSKFINIITFLESRFVLKLANHFATAIFTVNPVLKNEIIRLGVDKKKVLLSKNGLFINRIDKVASPKKKKYDGAYMGRITENKGVFDLILVWSELVKKNPKLKLAVMGTGRSDVVQRFTDEIKRKKLKGNIDYLGYVTGDKKYQVFKSSKLFIFLSKVNADESWGISLMEALACGTPAITYNLAIYKHVYDEDILQISKIGDVKSVMNKTFFFLNNGKERKKLSERSISFARQFDWFKIAKKDFGMMRKLLGARNT